MSDLALEFYCPTCAQLFSTSDLAPPSEAGHVLCPDCGGHLEAAVHVHAQSAERVVANSPSLLVDPMPWWLIHNGVQIIARVLVHAHVPACLRDSARKTTSPLDDVFMDALATAIERLALVSLPSDDGE
ncbi:hypothetical protein ES703_26816 [subsurface metagenome]